MLKLYKDLTIKYFFAFIGAMVILILVQFYCPVFRY